MGSKLTKNKKWKNRREPAAHKYVYLLIG